jgi:phosphoglycolate phosphatase-like HAD superfamily hydrolase
VTSVPDHWTWHGDPVDGGRAVVVDIDGVLSDAASRQHYLEAPRRDWDAFFQACGEDPVIEEVKVLLDLIDVDLRIVLLTARPERVHHLTEAWLRRYRIRWDLLLMRPYGDYDVARDFKQASVHELREHGFDLQLAIEDDRRNVEMFRKAAVPCIYFHSGYYD